MSFQIETARVVQYGQNFYMLAQQKMSRLRGAVMTDSFTSAQGKRVSMDQVGTTSFQPMQTRHGDTPLNSIDHARRWISVQGWNNNQMVDQLDKLQIITDPTNIYAQAQAAAAGRTIDSVILTAAYATATTGEDASGSVSFPSGQQIAVNSWAFGTGSGNTGLTISKLIEAKVLLDANETDPNEERYICCTAKQLGNLLSTTEVTSKDYNTVQALVTGQLSQFMGFNFIRSQQVPVDGSSYRRVLAWTKSGLGLAMQKEPTVRISERPDKNYSVQIYSETSLGASRLEEAKVVEIKCYE